MPGELGRLNFLSQSPREGTRENKSTALVKFGADLLTQGGGLEKLDDDRKITAIARAVMDTMPNVASMLLQKTTDVGEVVKSLLDWIDYLRSDQVTRLNKLRGLIDSLAVGNQLEELLKQIKYASVNGKDVHRNGYSNDTFLELAAADTERLNLLLRAAASDAELTKALLHIRGAIVRPRPGEETNDAISFMDHGLLCAAAYFGNKEATALLLEAAEKTSMAAEMFGSYSLIDTFGAAARHGDTAALKKIVELVRKAEQEDTVVQLGEETCVMAAMIKDYRSKYGLPDEANASAVLLIGTGKRGVSKLEMAIKSKNKETIEFISNLLIEDSGLLKVVGQVLHDSLKLSSRLEKKRHPDAYQVPESLEGFLKDLSDAAESQQTLCNFLIKLFSYKRSQSDPEALTSRVETNRELPGEYDHECYRELTRLMNLLDNMNQASGRGTEWARRLTVLFNDVEAAKYYLKNSMKWAMDSRSNPSVWQHRTNEVGPIWPEDMSISSKDHIEEIDALEVVMEFDFPSGEFNTAPWRPLLVAYPEASRYIGLAPEIEAYLASQSQPFPTTIEALRSVVLEVDIQKCGFSSDVAQKLRGRLTSGDVVDSEEPQEERQLRSGVLLAATVPPAVKDCVRRLCVMGVFHHTAATRWGEKLYHKPDYVVVENGVPRYAEDDYQGEPADGSVPWFTENYQTVVSSSAPLNELLTLADVLNDVHAMPKGGSVTLDMRKMDEGRKTEFVKQLCIAIARMLQDRRIEEIVCPASPLSKQSKLTPGEVVNAILASKDIGEIFETYWSNSAPVEFFRDDAQFNFRFPEFSSNLVANAFNDTHEFTNWCLSLVDANKGKARDVKEEALGEGSVGYRRLMGILEEK